MTLSPLSDDAETQERGDSGAAEGKKFLHYCLMAVMGSVGYLNGKLPRQKAKVSQGCAFTRPSACLRMHPVVSHVPPASDDGGGKLPSALLLGLSSDALSHVVPYSAGG